MLALRFEVPDANRDVSTPVTGQINDGFAVIPRTLVNSWVCKRS